MNRKILGILVMTLLIATAMLPIVNSENKNIQHVYDDNKSGNVSIISDDCGCIKNNVYNEIYTRFPVMEIKYKPLELIDSSPKPIAMEGLPEYFNWMDYEGQDWTTPAKNGIKCGGCWDFAAIGALESIINIREGNAELDMDLSEQYVLSCLPKSGSCRGGWSYSAFNYMKEYFIDGAYYNGSLPESCFPYVGIDVNGNNQTESGLEPVLCSEKCENWEEQLIPIKDCGSWIPDGSNEDREAIKTRIMQHGPVCTYFLVTWGFMGAFMEWGNESHNSTDYYPYKWANGINHVVVIVGWKDDPAINKGGYWICKNNWGTDWGYDGFFNIEYKSLNIDGFQIDWVDYDSDKKNWPPNKPVISGPEEGDMGEELIFSTSTTDPINREVYYLWDFGDGTTSEWIGPYNSGEIVSISNTWSDEGLYNVKVKSKNSDEKESKWSDSLIVGIPKKNAAIDQNQNSYDTGYGCINSIQFAQSFIPTEDTLSEIKLYMYKRGNPIKIMVIIRDDLYNMDLTSVEISAENIPERFSWITFDFPDIDVIPGETYYIVWNPIAFDYDNTFYWGFGDNDPYPNGCAWVGRHWKELEITGFNDPDFCFKTYHAKTKIKSFDTQIPWMHGLIEQFPILKFLENHPRMFPILRQLLGL